MFGGQKNILVLPDANGLPASVAQPLISVSIACPITRHFVSPVLTVPDGHRVMFGAAVPEAPVEKNSNPSPCEDEVGCAPDGRQGPRSNAIPHPECVHSAAQREFGGCVPASVCLHARAYSLVGSPRRLILVHTPIVGRYGLRRARARRLSSGPAEARRCDWAVPSTPMINKL